MRRHTIPLAIIVFALMLGGLVVFWASRQSNVVIELSTGGEATYKFIPQDQGGRTFTIKSAENPLRVRITKGKYNVFITSGKESSFLVFATKGWFRSTVLSGISLKEEYGREFLGSNVGSCMYHDGNNFMSYGCEAPTSDFKIHRPATDKLPSLAATSNSRAVAGTIQGVLASPEGPMIFVSSPNTEHTYGKHSLYRINPDTSEIFDPSPIRTLTELDVSTKYTAKEYGDGFIVHDLAFEQARYYPGFSVDAEPLSIQQFYRPSSPGLAFVDSSITKQHVAVLYSKSNSKSSVPSEILIGNEREAVRYKIPGNHTKLLLCGEGRLCLMGDRGLEVYGLSNESAVFEYSIPEAKDIFVVSGGLLILTSEAVIEFDVEARSGFASYQNGNYTVNSVYEYRGGYVLNISGSNQGSAAIHILPGSKSDDIDKKVAQLRTDPLIKGVTVYKSRIFVSPNVGEPVFNRELGYFAYSPERRGEAAKALPNVIQAAGIDTTKYTIINLLP